MKTYETNGMKITAHVDVAQCEGEIDRVEVIDSAAHTKWLDDEAESQGYMGDMIEQLYASCLWEDICNGRIISNEYAEIQTRREIAANIRSGK